MAVLARQARQAARYREIGTDLRRAEGMILFRRWREAADIRAALQSALAEAVTAASLPAPALVVIGEVVALRDTLA